MGPRRVVPQPPQRQRDPRRAGGQQPPPRHLGDHHRDHRRHLRRAALGDPPVLARPTSSRPSSRPRPPPSPSSCSASCCSSCSPSTPTSRAGPSGPSCAPQGIGPDTLDALLHPHRRAVAVPDPAGHHAGLRVDRARRPHDARLDARGAAGRLHAHGPGQGPDRARRSSCKHGLRNAMLPVVTLIGIDFGTVIGAAVLTETVFSWPGLGSEIANSVARARPARAPRADPGRRHRLRLHQPARRPLVRLVRPPHPARARESNDDASSTRPPPPAAIAGAAQPEAGVADARRGPPAPGRRLAALPPQQAGHGRARSSSSCWSWWRSSPRSIAPYGITERTSEPSGRARRPTTGSAPTPSAATCSAGSSTAPGCRCASASSPPRSR